MISRVRFFIGRLTSPFFVPLRKLVVWGDDNFGTCDHKLTVVPREILELTKNQTSTDSDITLSATEFYDKYVEGE